MSHSWVRRTGGASRARLSKGKSGPPANAKLPFDREGPIDVGLVVEVDVVRLEVLQRFLELLVDVARSTRRRWGRLAKIWLVGRCGDVFLSLRTTPEGPSRLRAYHSMQMRMSMRHRHCDIYFSIRIG